MQHRHPLFRLGFMTHRVFRHAALGAAAALADTNHLVILYPQAIASVIPANPEGCWDWWGYDGPNFAVKSAPQMVAIMNMVHALSG